MVGHLEVPELGKIRLRFLHILFIICFVGNWAFKAWFYRCFGDERYFANENICAQALIAGNDLLLAPRNLKRELDGVLNAVKVENYQKN